MGGIYMKIYKGLRFQSKKGRFVVSGVWYIGPNPIEVDYMPDMEEPTVVDIKSISYDKLRQAIEDGKAKIY